jgi:hypothetical protein
MMNPSKKTIVLFVTLGLMTGLSLAHATSSGVGSSGGGSAIVCRDANQKILSAEMYDLYEGKNYFGLAIEKNTDLPKQQILNVIQAMNQNAYVIPAVIQAVDDIIGKIQFLPTGVVISAPSDMGTDYPIIHPSACNVEGVGFYTSDNQLKVSQAVYSAFSNTDKAAFVLHEALYLIDRQMGLHGGDGSSETARALNSLLFSTNPSVSQVSGMAADVFLEYGQDLSANVPGANPSPLTIEITTNDIRGMDYQIENAECGLSPNMLYASTQNSFSPVFSNSNGVATVTLSDRPCYYLYVGTILTHELPAVPDATNTYHYPIFDYTYTVRQNGQVIYTVTSPLVQGDGGGFNVDLIHTGLVLKDLP